MFKNPFVRNEIQLQGLTPFLPEEGRLVLKNICDMIHVKHQRINEDDIQAKRSSEEVTPFMSNVCSCYVSQRFVSAESVAYDRH